MKILALLMLCINIVWANNADTAIKKFFKSVDQKDYALTWDEAAPIFQKALTKIQWEKSLKETHKPLGKNIKRKEINRATRSELPGVPKGNYTIVQFQSQYENEEKVIETITVKLEEKSWKLSGYYVKYKTL